MKNFATEYPDFPILQAPLAKFTVSADGNFVQVPLAQITWYHHISMTLKVKDAALKSRHARHGVTMKSGGQLTS